MTLPPLSDDNRLRDIALLLRERADLLDPPQPPPPPDLLDRMDDAVYGPAGERQCNAARLRVVADWFDEQSCTLCAHSAFLLRAEADKETP